MSAPHDDIPLTGVLERQRRARRSREPAGRQVGRDPVVPRAVQRDVPSAHRRRPPTRHELCRLRGSPAGGRKLGHDAVTRPATGPAGRSVSVPENPRTPTGPPQRRDKANRDGEQRQRANDRAKGIDRARSCLRASARDRRKTPSPKENRHRCRGGIRHRCRPCQPVSPRVMTPVGMAGRVSSRHP